MNTILYIIAGPLFLISLAAHIYAKCALRPNDPDLDDWYHEFEDQHPQVIRYNKWTKLTFAGITISVLLLFIAAIF